jgi:alpha-galactosidase
MEWDVRELEGQEREELKRFIGLYKEHRGLIHSGRMVRADVPDGSLLLHGVVAPDPAAAGTTAALFSLVRTRTAFAEQPGRVAVPGLEPDRAYRVEAIFPTPADADYAHNYTQVQPPAWLADGADASGRFLAEVGLPMPILNPEHAVLLRFTAL